MNSLYRITIAKKLLSSLKGQKMTSIRYKSNREKCDLSRPPPCPKHIKKGACGTKADPIEEPARPESKFKSLMDKPECCKEPCKGEYPRFDDLYWSPTDKKRRKYMITWAECPDLQVKKKRLCCFDKLILPPIERRPHRRDVKPRDYNPSDLMPCALRPSGNCPKFVLAGCRSTPESKKCFVIKKPSKCKKVCTPYPAFSECKLPKFKPVPPVECNCIKGPSLCTVWNLLRAGKLHFNPPKKY